MVTVDVHHHLPPPAACESMWFVTLDVHLCGHVASVHEGEVSRFWALVLRCITGYPCYEVALEDQQAQAGQRHLQAKHSLWIQRSGMRALLLPIRMSVRAAVS